jgi:arginase
MISVIGARFDLCGREPGSRLGPEAMEIAGLTRTLGELGYDATLEPIIGPISPEVTTAEGTLEIALDCYRGLKRSVFEAISLERVPLVVGGDHSLAIGSVAGAMEHYGENLAVLWIDAHMDMNTPRTSPSGNLHGMPLAALARLGDEPTGRPVDQAWRTVLSDVVPSRGLEGKQMAWVGLRDVDRGEEENLAKCPGAFATTMQDVDHHGISGLMDQLDQFLRSSGARHLWISFDVDSLDPNLAPGTGTAVRGGFTYREGHLIAETLHGMCCAEHCPYHLVGLDVVEVNPLRDLRNETAKVAVEWVASLMGKSILGGTGASPV